jgi:hypothetical protein
MPRGGRKAADRGEFDINVQAYGRAQADPSLLFYGNKPPGGPTTTRLVSPIHATWNSSAQGAVLNGGAAATGQGAGAVRPRNRRS